MVDSVLIGAESVSPRLGKANHREHLRRCDSGRQQNG